MPHKSSVQMVGKCTPVCTPVLDTPVCNIYICTLSTDTVCTYIDLL